MGRPQGMRCLSSLLHIPLDCSWLAVEARGEASPNDAQRQGQGLSCCSSRQACTQRQYLWGAYKGMKPGMYAVCAAWLHLTLSQQRPIKRRHSWHVPQLGVNTMAFTSLHENADTTADRCLRHVHID